MLDAVDAVYVCTWTSEHPRLVAAAAERGPAGVLREAAGHHARRRARRWPTAVAAAGVVNQVGPRAAQQPGLPRAQAPDRGPAQRPGPGRRAPRRPVPAGAGHVRLHVAGRSATRPGPGTMLEHSIHDVDALEWLLGPVRVGERAVEHLPRQPGDRGHGGGGHGARRRRAGEPHQRVAPAPRAPEPPPPRGDLRARLLHARARRGRARSRGPARASTGSLEGGELFSAVAERHDGRSPNQDAGFVEAVASGEPGPHPDFATALRAHVVVDGDLPLGGRGRRRAGRTSARPDEPAQPRGG